MRRLLLITAAVFVFGSLDLVYARPNFNIDSLNFQLYTGAQASLPRGCWGYIDSATGNEYALITSGTKLDIWDVTTPSAPFIQKTVFATGGELKQVRPYSHYVLAVNQVGTAIQVIDLAPLLTDPQNVITVKNFNVPTHSGAHAIHIDGHYAYLGMNGSADPWYIVDISDPLNPVMGGNYLTSAASGFRQSHDSYVKGNTAYISFLGSGFSIVDITNKSAPQRLADVIYPSPILNHNCWTTEDGKYLYTTDELPNGYIRIWDVHDPRNPIQVGSWSAGVPGSDVHNVQVKGDLLYASYYAEGVEILDIEDPTQPIEVGHFDTDPAGGGCWDFFNFFPSGTLVASNYYGSAKPGMWLLKFNGARAAKITGVVTNAINNQELPGVKIRLLEVSRQVFSDTLGSYLLRSEAGPRTLEFSRSGFQTETLLVNTVFSETLTVNVSLAPLYTGQLTGQVRDAKTGLSVPGAKVGLFGDEFFQDVTDGSGNFSVSFLPTGQPVSIASAFWGYLGRLDTFTLSGTPLDTVIRLGLGYSNDMEFNLGWSTAASDDNATEGFWERVVPVAAFNNSAVPFQTQPGADHTPDPGRMAFITGQALPNFNFNDHDVDNGKVTLTTPLIDLTGFNKPVLSYWRWFTNSGGTNPSTDTLFVEISSDSGVTWIPLEQNRFSATSWQQRTFPLRGRTPPVLFTNKMFVRFVATDRGGSSTVEAGVDDFKVVESLVTGDVNGDSKVDLVDIQSHINGTFLGSPAITIEAGDYSGDCTLSSVDVVRLINYFFFSTALNLTCLP